MRGELRHLPAGAGRKLLLLGDVRTVRVNGADTGGELTVLEQAVEPGAGAGLHRHAYQELFYVLEGELEFSGENGTFAAAAGAAVFAAAGVAHGYRNAGATRARFLAIVQPAGPDGFFDE